MAVVSALRKHSGGLESVLKEIGVHCDKPNTYTPDIVRDDKIINDLVPDILQYNVVALKATYGMGKTFGGLTPAVKYIKTKRKHYSRKCCRSIR